MTPHLHDTIACFQIRHPLSTSWDFGSILQHAGSTSSATFLLSTRQGLELKGQFVRAAMATETGQQVAL